MRRFITVWVNVCFYRRTGGPLLYMLRVDNVMRSILVYENIEANCHRLGNKFEGTSSIRHLDGYQDQFQDVTTSRGKVGASKFLENEEDLVREPTRARAVSHFWVQPLHSLYTSIGLVQCRPRWNDTT